MADKFAFELPPVREMGLSVMTAEPLANLYEIKAIHDIFRDRFPIVQRQPPFFKYNPFSAISPINQVYAQNFVTNPSEPIRYWFLDDDESDVVQVQDSFFARNWRNLRLEPGRKTDYPGYDALRSDFVNQIRSIEKLFEKISKPDECEILYDNLIPLRNSDGSVRPRAEVLTCVGSIGFVAGYSMSWFEHVDGFGEPPWPQPDFQVSITQVAAPYGEVMDFPFMRLMLMGRSKQSTWDGVFDFFDRAHAHARRRLTELTTDAARESWKSL